MDGGGGGVEWTPISIPESLSFAAFAACATILFAHLDANLVGGWVDADFDPLPHVHTETLSFAAFASCSATASAKRKDYRIFIVMCILRYCMLINLHI